MQIPVQPGKQDAECVHPEADQQAQGEAFAGVSGRAALPRVQEAAENVLLKQGTVYEHEYVDPDERQILQQKDGAAVHVGEQVPDQAHRQIAEHHAAVQERQRNDDHGQDKVPLFLVGLSAQGTRVFIHDGKPPKIRFYYCISSERKLQAAPG